MNMSMCSKYVHMSMDVRGGQKMMSGLTDLDVQMVVSHWIWGPNSSALQE